MPQPAFGPIFRGMAPASAPDPALAPLVERTRGGQPWRRLFHAANGLLVVGILVVLDPPWLVAVAAAALVTAGCFALDLLRFAWPALNRLFFRVLRPLASPREAEGVASSTWYMLGVLLALLAFPRGVAVIAILVLALADPAASWVGRKHGRRSFGGGTRLGTGVFAGVTFAVVLPLAWVPGTGAPGLVAAGSTALLVAALTALAEAFSGPFDDNLLVPLVAGATYWTLLPLF